MLPAACRSVLMRLVMAGEMMASSSTLGLALVSVMLYVTDTPEPKGREYVLG